MKRQTLNPKRVYYLMIVSLVLVAILGIASLYFANSILQKQTNKLISLKLQYKIPEADQNALQLAKADIVKYSDLMNTAKAIVPQQKDQAQAVREIVNYADQTGIRILSIDFPSSNLGSAPAVVPTGTTKSNDKTSGNTLVTPPVSQVQPVQGIPGLYVLPITVQSNPASPVSFDQITSFLAKLEDNRRTAQVGTISITPQVTAVRSGLSFTLTVNVYIKP